MKEIEKKNQSRVAVQEPVTRVYYRPKVSEPSHLIKEEEVILSLEMSFLV